MNKNLRALISAYQENVRIAVELMQKSGIPMPLSCSTWVDTDLSTLAELKNGIGYYKHGYGCQVDLPTGSVDFDFGRMGEIDGFNLWWLSKFAGAKFEKYGFRTKEEISGAFLAAVKSGALISSDKNMYYLADAKRSLAIEVCMDFSDDLLPHRDQDRILILYATNFLAADLMRQNHDRLFRKWKKNDHLSLNDQINIRIYFYTWLGYLGVTCEGFKKLRMRPLLKDSRPKSFNELIPNCDEITSLLKLHSDSLREFRNNVFHLRDDIKAILRFAFDDEGRLAWAGELHFAIEKFFSQYRVLCEVHYLMHNRSIESRIVGQPAKRRKVLPP
jgi:hypothetical protein